MFEAPLRQRLRISGGTVGGGMMQLQAGEGRRCRTGSAWQGRCRVAAGAVCACAQLSPAEWEEGAGVCFNFHLLLCSIRHPAGWG